MTGPRRRSPGWYADPDGTAGQLRWWDGMGWSSSTKPGEPSAEAAAAASDTDALAAGPAHPFGSWRPNQPADPRPPAPKSLWRRPAVLWTTGITATVVVAVVIVLVIVNATSGLASGGVGPFGGPESSKPPLAQLCPPPTADPSLPPGKAPPDNRPRVSDQEAGISYAKVDGPWEPWHQVWQAGTLGVEFKTGYYFVTEPDYQPGRDYLASVLSGAVPATVNDGTEVDLKCTGKQVVEDVRANFYPNPNTTEMMRDELTSLGGRPAWVSVFRLHFHTEGLRATSELVGVVLVDVGKPTAAVLYLSIPNTHQQYDNVVNDVINSVRPL
ncbi:DUF2510 domain-containing protein [Fodinicola acaciae]|uniref:DUF2510 domain-containing protein n=1 Tax=Fodinicola acaciae TaxID=2681555 RepID=UPI0013D37267|nr:DUF2510 domain-containing protein [Fodinicola acaciae]